MSYLLEISQKDGTKIVLTLRCKEYHANKACYSLSRALDRSIFSGVRVVAVDAFTAELATKFDVVEII